MNKLLTLLLLAAGLTGCIRDNLADCPGLKVTVDVRDRNYFNVDKVDLEERLPGNLPLKTYAPTLSWVIRDAETGETLASDFLAEVTEETPTVDLEFCADCLPHGRYVLTVWGGLTDVEALGDDPTSLAFHPGNLPGDDVYMTNDTLLYDADHSEYVVDLERTKGKLIISKENLPAAISGSRKTVGGLFGAVDAEFAYSGRTSVSVATALDPSVGQTVTKTVLAPSIEEKGSALALTFPGSGIEAKGVNITMKRNELTVLRYVWNPAKRDFDIYVLVNTNWEHVTAMEIL